MNIIAVIILIAIVVDFVIHTCAEILNLKALREELPESFRRIYPAERYRQSQAYLRVNTRFGWICASFNLILILAVWFGKGFPLLDGWIRNWDFNPILSGMIYIGILICLKGFLSLPFNIYATFVIEERFGFNTTTWSTFAVDIIKGIGLSILLGAPLLAGVLAFFEYAGAGAWWLCWIAVSLFMIILQYIIPTWIMPIFNKFEPLEDGELKSGIMAYADKIGFPLEQVSIMDGSKRSKKANAFFTGFGRHKRVVLFDTLLEQHSQPEIVAILAHEMGHYKKRHILFMMAAGVAQLGIIFFLLSVFISNRSLFDAFYMEHVSVYAGLIFFGMLYAPVNFFTGLLMQVISRNNEYAADRFAVVTTGRKQPLADALKKLSVHNLSNLLPHPFYVFLNYSHPPVLERIAAIEKTVIDR
jgi:STE24 endopeptidase